MTNTAVTGATFDIDGGQQLVEGRARGQETPLFAKSIEQHALRRREAVPA